MAKKATVYTAGHSNHAVETFLNLLRQFGITVVVDVRSRPYSRYVPHFNKEQLHRVLEAAGLKYIFMGRELGGQPQGEEYYDQNGRVLYDKLALSDELAGGIARLEKGLGEHCVALICSEENPLQCHRFRLLGQVLQKRGVELIHIRADGTSQLQSELAAQEQQQKEENEKYRQLQIMLTDNETNS